MSEGNVYKFDVKMTCGGCSNAVTRALSKAEVVSAYDVNLEKQEVYVRSAAPYDEILEKIKKTGKEVRDGRVVPEGEAIPDTLKPAAV